jgi:FkbM family methyltransferase
MSAVDRLRQLYRSVVPEEVRWQVYDRRMALQSYTERFGILRGAVNHYSIAYSPRRLVRLHVPGYAGPFHLRKDTADHGTFVDVIWREVYAAHAVPTVRPRVIVDAGANVGYTTAYWARTYPDAQVIAIEPSADNFALLECNTARYPKVRVLRGGLWPRPGFLRIKNPTADTDAFRVREVDEGVDVVPAITPEDILRMSPTGSIDILKMDIEGAEHELFSSDPQWLDRVTGTLVVEVHERLRPGCLKTVTHAVARYGFIERGRDEHLVMVFSRASLLPARPGEALSRDAGGEAGGAGVRPVPLHPIWPPVRFGSFRRLKPISRSFGMDRGKPIDRYYIESFIERHRADIRGRVLEAGGFVSYTKKFGGGNVAQADVLYPRDYPDATIVGDLATGRNIPSAAFDCLILTQVFQCLYEVTAAIRHSHRALRPGGVLLATLPGICHISRRDVEQWGDYWRFTDLAARRLFGEVFGPENVTVEARGNVLTACAFLQGLATRDLRPEELTFADEDYQLSITVRAVRAADGSAAASAA